MQTVLLWLRILLTLLILGFPLYHLGKRLYSLFYATTKHLQDQIDIAKDRIRMEPQQDESENNEEDTPYVSASNLEDEINNTSATPDLEEELISDDITGSELSTPSIPDTKHNAYDESTIVTTDDLEQSATGETKQAISGHSAEKLAQTVDDIKYAALTYKERGKKDDYEKKLVEGISLVGDHEEFLTMLADHYFEEGHYVKAATLLKKIIHINPTNHRAIRQLGQIYAHDNDKETAKLLLEKARDLKDDNPKYLISLVEVYYEENNIRECITIVEKLSKLRPTNIDYLLTLGKLHEELNQPTKAHSYYMKVQELNPTNDEAKQAIRRLL